MTVGSPTSVKVACSAATAGQRKEVVGNPDVSMSFRLESPGVLGSAVAVDLPGVDKRRLRRCSFDEGAER